MVADPTICENSRVCSVSYVATSDRFCVQRNLTQCDLCNYETCKEIVTTHTDLCPVVKCVTITTKKDVEIDVLMSLTIVFGCCSLALGVATYYFRNQMMKERHSRYFEERISLNVSDEKVFI